jgi:hypothetical protein
MSPITTAAMVSATASVTDILLAQPIPSPPILLNLHGRVTDESRTSIMAVVTVAGVTVGLLVGVFVYVFLVGPCLERFGILRWTPDIETEDKTPIPQDNKLEDRKGANMSMC